MKKLSFLKTFFLPNKNYNNSHLRISSFLRSRRLLWLKRDQLHALHLYGYAAIGSECQKIKS